MLKLPENHKNRFVKCEKCGYQSLFIVKDLWWSNEKNDHFCVDCQKKYNLGYFKKTKNDESSKN